MSRDRKLHVVHTPHGTTAQVCRYHVAEQREELLSSTDGVVACEVFRPGDVRAAHWQVIAERKLEVDRWAPVADIARAAFYAFAEPDVGAIHVVDIIGTARTFVRDRANWLDVPRFPHPVYSVPPRAARA